eukprot:gb/GECG01000526.1/.p1 GENE.gb/GECG01000526.1/~~gb/GECG01000526.1/.p1  ORF type:complete len:206 (+),score=26.54 gb/GECG01000526.1/:1-618(+)
MEVLEYVRKVQTEFSKERASDVYQTEGQLFGWCAIKACMNGDVRLSSEEIVPHLVQDISKNELSQQRKRIAQLQCYSPEYNVQQESGYSRVMGDLSELDGLSPNRESLRELECICTDIRSWMKQLERRMNHVETKDHASASGASALEASNRQVKRRVSESSVDNGGNNIYQINVTLLQARARFRRCYTPYDSEIFQDSRIGVFSF